MLVRVARVAVGMREVTRVQHDLRPLPAEAEETGIGERFSSPEEPYDPTNRSRCVSKVLGAGMFKDRGQQSSCRRGFKPLDRAWPGPLPALG